jgi:hypothetical protein
VKLPDGLTCSQCVLQWKYRAGNNWGSEDGLAGLGYGIQEEFYNCADIAIGSFETKPPIITLQTSTLSTTTSTLSSTTSTTLSTTTSTSSKTSPTTTIKITSTTSTSTKLLTTTTPYDYRDLRYIVCEVINEWKYYDGMFEYCIRICSDITRECKLIN